jgi:glucosylceramidase
LRVFYTLHLKDSENVLPGAVRISAMVPTAHTEMGIVAFQNADGSKAMVAANYSTVVKIFTVKQGAGYFSDSVPPKSVATIVW